MLTDDYIEQSADETSEEFNSLEILLLIWMALRLKKLADLENITEDYDSWKETATKEFSEYVGTQFSKTRKTALGLVKSVVQKGVEKTLNESKKRVEEYTEVKKDTVLTQPIKKILNKGVKDTQDEIKNLCNISRKCTNRQFIRYCDQAYSKIVAGQDAEKAIESSIRSLAKKGIEVIGYTDSTTSLDAAVKRAVTTGVNQTALKSSLESCNDYGINIVKTSSHSGARPSHAEWQGQFFYLNKPVKGLKKFKSATGYGKVDGLGGANCRHSFYEVTDYEYKHNLVKGDRFNKNRNEEQYELEQKQRYYERQIRKWKKEKQILDEAGIDSTLATKKVKEWQSRRTEFIKTSNKKFNNKHGVKNVLKTSYQREKVIK